MINASNDITTSKAAALGASAIPLKSGESPDGVDAGFGDSRFVLETSRGRLAFALPLTIAATVPSTAHTEEGDENQQGAIDSDPVGPVESSIATALGIAGLSIALAYGLALGKVIAAKRRLRGLLFEQRKVLDARIGHEIKALLDETADSGGEHKAQVKVGNDNSVDSCIKFQRIPGLSKEWTDLSEKFVQLLRTDMDAARLPGMVGPTQALAGYWLDTGHRRYSEVMSFGAKMLVDEVHGTRNIEGWLDLREIFFRRLPVPVMRRYSASGLYRLLARKHERIARERRHGTRVHGYEIALVRSLHLVAAAMLWRIHADYIERWKSKMAALSFAKVDVDRAIARINNVEEEKGAFWSEKGVRPLADLHDLTIELRDRINMDMRRSINPPPPDDPQDIPRPDGGRQDDTPLIVGPEPTGPLNHGAMIAVSRGALSFAGFAVQTLAFAPII